MFGFFKRKPERPSRKVLIRMPSLARFQEWAEVPAYQLSDGAWFAYQFPNIKKDGYILLDDGTSDPPGLLWRHV